MTIPVTISSNSIPRFLEHIRTAGIPNKVTNPYLKSVGFKSSNDGALIGIFKTLGYIDNSGAPTDTWKAYRNTAKAPVVLAEAIRHAYSGLFNIYPDAHRKDDEAILNWIRSNSNYAGLTVNRALTTFKTLCREADFNKHESVAKQTEAVSAATDAQAAPSVSVAGSALKNININLELHMPATTDPKIYENFFAAMRKHLVDNVK